MDGITAGVGSRFVWARTPLVMGVVNATPDSFAGTTPDPVALGRAMIDAGADLLDIGGESTRPGAEPVPADEEQRRVLPVLRALAGSGVPLSIDTRRAATMAAALDAGASIVNDISGLAHDPDAPALLAGTGCGVVLMHMRGTPQTMAGLATYGDVVEEVLAALAARLAAASAAGIAPGRIALDPGIGFAKTAAQNVALLQGLPRLRTLGCPILVGVSRKSFIGHYGREPDVARRAPGSIAAALFALSRGASILRVHDVAETVQAVRVWQTLAT